MAVVEALMERWMMRDPFYVVARRQEQERRRLARSKEVRQERAREALKAVFGGSMTDTVSSEIENWIAWCWEGEDPAPFEPTRCYSAEGRYTAPAWHEDERRPKRIINRQSAERVQAVYDQMPDLTRQVLRFEYTQRAAYDQYEQGEEIAPEGGTRKVQVLVANTRRQMARLRLKIGKQEYQEHVERFKEAVREEFSEVCA